MEEGVLWVTSAVSETALELPSLLSLVAELAVTDVGRLRVEGLRPVQSRTAARISGMLMAVIYGVESIRGTSP